MCAVPNTPTRFIGCDVGKATVVIFDTLTGQTQTLPNTAKALSAAMAAFDDTCLLVCESTGGYEAALLAAALAAGRAAHRADARKVKHFIRSFGTLGKTDALDAQALASYGRERHGQLARWQEPDRHRDRLQVMVLARQDLVAQRQAFKNRLAAPGVDPVKAPIKAVVACLDTQIQVIDRGIQDLIQSHEPLKKATAALRSIGGFGPVVTAGLLGLMPELGHIGRREIAALAGLAPHPNQSGKADGYRRTRGGRDAVRPLLFMAALVAARSNPKLKTIYQRLIANQKKPIVAITALMRKLIVIANAVVRDAMAELKIDAQVS